MGAEVNYLEKKPLPPSILQRNSRKKSLWSRRRNASFCWRRNDWPKPFPDLRRFRKGESAPLLCLKISEKFQKRDVWANKKERWRKTTLPQIGKEYDRKRWHKAVSKVAVAAAIFSLVFLMGMPNPVLAQKIPFIGKYSVRNRQKQKRVSAVSWWNCLSFFEE